MPVTVHVVLNSDEIKKFLQTDPGIEEDLTRRGQAVAEHAEAQMSDPARDGEPHFAVAHLVGHDRQRVSVRTRTAQARIAEAQEHVLLKSVDAARSP